jgi:hypothetical protein
MPDFLARPECGLTLKETLRLISEQSSAYQNRAPRDRATQEARHE